MKESCGSSGPFPASDKELLLVCAQRTYENLYEARTYLKSKGVHASSLLLMIFVYTILLHKPIKEKLVNLTEQAFSPERILYVAYKA